jgi:hypothetical protein
MRRACRASVDAEKKFGVRFVDVARSLACVGGLSERERGVEAGNRGSAAVGMQRERIGVSGTHRMGSSRFL